MSGFEAFRYGDYFGREAGGLGQASNRCGIPAQTWLTKAPATNFHSGVAYAPLLGVSILRESDAIPDPGAGHRILSRRIKGALFPIGANDAANRSASFRTFRKALRCRISAASHLKT